jgi:hypothetical protein
MAVKSESTFLYFDRINENGRMYPKELASKIIENFNNIKERNMNFGEFGYPDRDNIQEISLKNISHSIEEIHYNEEKNSLDGTIELLSTKYGEIAKETMGEWVIRPRGIGNINEKKEIENFQIISFDLITKETDAFKKIENEENPSC